MSVLGERLRAERKLRGWTLEQAGEVFGLPKSTLANYETGAYEPDVALLKRFASVYACSVDYLVGKDDKRELLDSGIDADIALRVHDVAQQLTPEAKTDRAHDLFARARDASLVYRWVKRSLAINVAILKAPEGEHAFAVREK